MARTILKVLTFSLISLVSTQVFLQTFDLGTSPFLEFILLLLTLFLLNMFIQPVLKVVSLPDKGFKFFAIYFLFSIIFILILVQIIEDIRVVELHTSNLLFVSDMVPSSSLPSSISLVVTAFVLSLVYRYFMWLSVKK